MDAAATLTSLAHQALPIAASSLGDAGEKAGVVVAALLAAGAVLAKRPQVRGVAALGALLLTPVLLVGHIWDSPQIEPLRDHPAPAAMGALAALAAAGVLAAAMRRRPALLPVLAIAALPFRLPISVGGQTASLLVPLYGVVAAGTLAFAIPALRGVASLGPGRREARGRALEALLAGAVVLYAIQATYSSDFSKALEQVVFFYVPFLLLFALLREVDWTPRVLRTCLAVAAGLALVFVGVGFVEYARKELFWNPKVINANQFESYFRVNSLFFDPNIYGRFLALVMLSVCAAVLWVRRRRDGVIGALVLVALWAGLVLSFSQSSFAALLAGLAVLGGLRWSARWAAALAVAAVAAGAAFIAIAPGAVHLELGSSKSADKATSGRYALIKGGARLFADRPLQGYGAGAFAREYRHRRHASSARAVSASHTIPVTVAAEQGIVGLAVYLALLVAALARLFRGAAESPARAAVAAAFTALVVHTLLYAAFLEDPLTWTLLGIGTALAARAAARAWGAAPPR
jgi:O-antigen ligase